MSDWLQPQANGAILTLHIQPGAKETAVAGIHGTALKIRLAAPPVDGKANEALLAFVAHVLSIPKRDITLLSGQTSRSKRIEVSGVTAERIRQQLLGIA